MKGIRNCIIALLLGCCAPLLIWIGAGSALYQHRKRESLLGQALKDTVCSIDADCPPGFVCRDGHCVPMT